MELPHATLTLLSPSIAREGKNFEKDRYKIRWSMRQGNLRLTKALQKKLKKGRVESN